MINLTSSKLRFWESHIWWRAVPRLCKEFLNSQNKKISNPILKKMGRFEQALTLADIWMANKHLRRYSTSLVIREIKTTMRH